MKKIIKMIIILMLVFIPKVYAQDAKDSTIFESRIINISVDVERRIMHIKEILRVENTNPNINYYSHIGKNVNTNLNNYKGYKFSIYEDGEYYITYDVECVDTDCIFNYLNIYNEETPITYKNLEINIVKENGKILLGPNNDLSSFSKQEENGNIYLSLIPNMNGYVDDCNIKIYINNPIENNVETILILIMFIGLLVDILIYNFKVKPFSKTKSTIPKGIKDELSFRIVKYGAIGSIYVVVYSFIINLVGELVRKNYSVTVYNIVTDCVGIFLFVGAELIWLIYLINTYKLYKKLIDEK